MVLGERRALTALIVRAAAAPFIWLRVPPNVVTALTLVPATACAWALATGQLGLGLALGFLAGMLDVVDGAVARANARQTAFGGFLDSLIDRYVDVALIFGVAFAVQTNIGWIAGGVAVAGSYATSYARARAYQDTQVPARVWGQWFERAERLILLALAVVAQMVLNASGVAFDALLAGLVTLAVLSNVTVVQRVLTVRRLMAAP